MAKHVFWRLVLELKVFTGLHPTKYISTKGEGVHITVACCVKRVTACDGRQSQACGAKLSEAWHPNSPASEQALITRAVLSSTTSAISLNMDFTEIYRQSGNLVAFSPGAHFILTAVADHLVVRRADTFHVSRSWHVLSSPSRSAATIAATATSSRPVRAGSGADSTTVISHIGWSPDSEYVFAACAKLGLVYVFRMRDDEWTAHIETGAEGLTRAEWAPDGRHVLCFSEWGVSSHNCHESIFPPFVLIVLAPCNCVVPCCRYSNVHPVSPTP